MEENGKMTVKDALEITIRLLEEIRVPVSLWEPVTVPISQAVANLKACVRGLERAAEEEETDGRVRAAE